MHTFLPNGFGFALIENRWLTKVEVETFPERVWWRRLYRSHRVDRITHVVPELYFMPPDRIYGHPVVIRRLKEILKPGMSAAVIHEVAAGIYPPLSVETSYVYDWRLATWLIVFSLLILAVCWFATCGI